MRNRHNTLEVCVGRVKCGGCDGEESDGDGGGGDGDNGDLR